VTLTIRTTASCAVFQSLLTCYVFIAVSRKDFTKNSCLIVFIMSHGSANDTIMAKDGQFYSFQDDVVEYCTSNRTLNDKPKLFVLQACRGDATMVADATPSMSYKGDIIIFQSSYQGKNNGKKGKK